MTNENEEVDMLDKLKQITLLAIDRDIVVYDSVAQPGQFTKRLVDLLEEVMLKNGGHKMIAVYTREGCPIITRIPIYHVEDELWNQLEKFYFTDQGAVLAEEDYNVVLAVGEGEPTCENVLIGGF